MGVLLVRSRIVVLGLACGRLLRAPGTPCSVEHWDRVSRASVEPRWLAGSEATLALLRLRQRSPRWGFWALVPVVLGRRLLASALARVVLGSVLSSVGKRWRWILRGPFSPRR